MFVRNEFEQLVRQFSKDNRPLKVKCTRKEYTEGGRELESSLSFENKVFVEAFRKKEEC